jgi:diguanylate cyclase (GGDEF)-like protein
MTIAALALIAATAALVAVAGVVAVVRRSSGAADKRLHECLRVMSARMDGLAEELATSVRRVEEDATRARILASLGGTLDLEEVLTRCAEAADSLPGVTAAAVTVEVDGALMAAGAGVDAATVGAMVGPPGSADARAVGISYHYGDNQPNAALLSAVAVPIVSRGVRLGFLTVYGRTEEPPISGTEFQTLEAIADLAGPAIEKANRRAAPHVPTPDALTGLGNRLALHEALALEVARAHRAGGRVALCVLDVDDLGAANARLGQAATDALLSEIASILQASLGPGATAYRSGGDEFAVVLTDSGRIDAEATFARVQASLRRLAQPIGRAPSLSAGIAELKSDDDGVSLFERAEKALRRAKETTQGRDVSLSPGSRS